MNLPSQPANVSASTRKWDAAAARATAAGLQPGGTEWWMCIRVILASGPEQLRLPLTGARIGA